MYVYSEFQQDLSASFTVFLKLHYLKVSGWHLKIKSACRTRHCYWPVDPI